MISLSNITKSYKVGNHALEVLKQINLEIGPGELVSIMGSSGSGKSTMLNILGILDDYDSGQYMLDNTLIRNLTERKAAYYRNQFIGFVFQSFNLLSFKNAMENVALPLYYQKVGRKKAQQNGSGISGNGGIKGMGRTHAFRDVRWAEAARGYCKSFNFKPLKSYWLTNRPARLIRVPPWK
jgi:ABC-type lipoprotein export system ATPase subunit